MLCTWPSWRGKISRLKVIQNRGMGNILIRGSEGGRKEVPVILVRRPVNQADYFIWLRESLCWLNIWVRPAHMLDFECILWVGVRWAQWLFLRKKERLLGIQWIRDNQARMLWPSTNLSLIFKPPNSDNYLHNLRLVRKGRKRRSLFVLIQPILNLENVS